MSSHPPEPDAAHKAVSGTEEEGLSQRQYPPLELNEALTPQPARSLGEEMAPLALDDAAEDVQNPGLKRTDDVEPEEQDASPVAPAEHEVSNPSETSEVRGIEVSSSPGGETKKPKSKGKAPVYFESPVDTNESEVGPSTSTARAFKSSPGEPRPRSSAPETVPWEMDPERQPEKLPIRFKDILGRSYLIPWRTASTWDGMKETIDGALAGLDDSLRTAVSMGRFDMSINTAPASDPLMYVQKAPSTNPLTRRFFHVLPEFWDELIHPGALAIMKMWPRAPPAGWPWSINPPPGGMGPPSGRYPPPRVIVVNVRSPKKARTRRNQGQPVKVSRSRV